MPLMDGYHAKEVRRWACGCGGPLPGPVHGCNVVGGVFGGTLADVVALDDSLLLEEAAGQFLVGVGDVASPAVVAGEEASLDGDGDWHPPDNWVGAPEAMTSEGAVWPKGTDSGGSWLGCWAW
jgi:hypothetical protein